MKRIIFLDIETTGLLIDNGDKIIEIGCVEVYNNFITGRIFHSFFNPLIKNSKNAYNIHGIKDDFLKDKPIFKKKIFELLGFLNNSVIIAHNAQFDLRFLNKEIFYCNINILKIQNIAKVYDSLSFIRKINPRKKNTLDELCKRYKILNIKRNHNALNDAFLLALLMIKIGFLENNLKLYYENEYN